MAGGGKQQSSSVSPLRNPRSISFSSIPTLLAVFLALAIPSILFIILSSSSPARCSPDLNRGRPLTTHFSDPGGPNTRIPTDPPPEYSFVASLEKFLASAASAPKEVPDLAGGDAAAESLDKSISLREEEDLYGVDPVKPWTTFSLLRVYVYEMPARFTYDLLRLFQDTYRQTTNLTSNGSPVHRLIEQHSVDYWLWVDLISPESKRLLKNVVRVRQQEDADLFYIPFFTTISYFLLERHQCKALYRVWEHLQGCFEVGD